MGHCPGQTVRCRQSGVTLPRLTDLATLHEGLRRETSLLSVMIRSTRRILSNRFRVGKCFSGCGGFCRIAARISPAMPSLTEVRFIRESRSRKSTRMSVRLGNVAPSGIPPGNQQALAVKQFTPSSLLAPHNLSSKTASRTVHAEMANILIIGSNRGIGLALAEEIVRAQKQISASCGS